MTTRIPWIAIASLVMCALAAPAHAGTGWTTPQQIDPKPGSDINLSDVGSTAVWIRTDTGSGPVRWNYRVGKGAWKKSKALPLTSGVSDVQINSSATVALMRAPLEWQASTRVGTTWSTPVGVGLPSTAESVTMSRTGNVIAFVDSAGSTLPPAGLPCTVKAMTANPDGAWAAPVVIGSTPAQGYGCPDNLALSADGSTLAWLDTGYSLNISRLVGGVWTAQSAVFVPGYTLYYLALSADGNRVLWQYATEDNTYTQTFAAGAWSPAVSVTSAGAIRPVSSADAQTFAFDSESGFETYWFTGSGWKQVVLRSGNLRTSNAVSNTVVAFAQQSTVASSPLRVSVLNGATWSSPVQVAKSAINPAVSTSGKSLVWMSRKKKALYAVRR